MCDTVCQVRHSRWRSILVYQRGYSGISDGEVSTTRKELASHSGFLKEMSKLQHFFHERACVMLSKFHCEVNLIEQCYVQLRDTHEHALITHFLVYKKKTFLRV